MLQLNANRFSSAKLMTMREITLLLLGARTAVALDTEMEDVRHAVEQYRQDDEAIRSETFQSSPEWVVIGVRGSDHKIVRLRGLGVTAARELAQRLVTD